MFIIAGLGNPGLKYAGTRHNVGFGAIDMLAEKYGIDVDARKHKALIGKGVIEGQKVILVKPQTYMNLSGESIQAVAAYYKLSPKEVLVIYDDVNLDVGRLRIREKGSAGGHNGMKSIISGRLRAGPLSVGRAGRRAGGHRPGRPGRRPHRERADGRGHESI